MHNFVLKMHVWKSGAYYTHVIKFLEKIPEYNHRTMQFTTMDSHLSAYADVLEHTSHTAYIKDSFPSHLPQSCITCSSNRLWMGTLDRSKCVGEILQHIFHSKSMTSALYSFWQSSNAEACGNRAAWCQLSYDVALTGRDADRPHIHNSRCPQHPHGLCQSYTHCTQIPPTVRSCSPAGGHCVGPPRVINE